MILDFTMKITGILLREAAEENYRGQERRRCEKRYRGHKGKEVRGRDHGHAGSLQGLENARRWILSWSRKVPEGNQPC